MLTAIAIFYRELRRRRVLNTLFIYLVCCWILMQVVDVLFPVVGYDDADAKIIFVLIGLGIPICFVSAWFYQITKNAIVRTPAFQEQRINNADCKYYRYALTTGALKPSCYV